MNMIRAFLFGGYATTNVMALMANILFKAYFFG
jgi:hypothetical protein